MFGGKLRSQSVLLPLICVLLPAIAHAGTMTSEHAERPSVGRPLFDFHSSFWVNLHQVLFHEAKLRAGRRDRGLQLAAPLSAADMSKKEEADWSAAVNFYAAHFAARLQYGPHGDDQLIQINDALVKQPDTGARLTSAGLPPEMVAVLQSAAPIYRRYWWPAHDKSNEDWIASQKERLQNLGPKLASEMTSDLRQHWPAAPIRVDVCYDVVALGNALTTLAPPHITFSSGGPSNQDLSGFELLFHEASHTYADTMMNALSAEGRTQHKDVGDLWHALLFFTSGVDLRRLLPAPERASFTPYAYRYGVYRGRWRQYRRVLEADWQPYLDGKMGFDAAIRAMVTDLRSSPVSTRSAVIMRENGAHSRSI